MIIQSLKMINFKQYADACIEFKEGLVGIIGKNGSGKSTLFDAIMCALYGELPVNKELIRCSFAGDNATVKIELVCQIEGNQYTILREFRGKNLNAFASLYKNDQAIVTGAGEVSRAIEKIIGMSKEAFKRSVFAAQGELREISESRGGQRRELIRKIMGFQMLDEILQVIRNDKNDKKRYIDGQVAMLFTDEEIADKQEQLKNLSSEFDAKEKELQNIVNQYTEAQKKLSGVKQLFDTQQRKYQKYNELMQESTKLNSALDNCKKNINDVRSRLVELEKMKEECEKLKEDEQKYLELKKQKDKLEELRIKDKEKIEIEKQLKVLKEELNEKNIFIQSLEEEIASLGTISDAISDNEKNKKDIEITIKNLQKQYLELSHNIGGIQKAIQDRRKHIEYIKKLGKNAECPTCLRPLQEAYDATIKRLSNEIEQYQNNEIATLQNQLQGIDKSIQAAEKAKKEIEEKLNTLNQTKAQLTVKKKNIELIKKELLIKQKQLDTLHQRFEVLKNVVFDENTYNHVVNEYNRCEKIHARFIELSARINEIPSLQKKIQDLQKQNSEFEAKIKSNSLAIQKLDFAIKDYEQSKREYEQAFAQQESLAKKMHEEEIALQRLHHTVEQIKSELQRDNDNRKKVEEARNELVLLQRLESVMDDFRSWILLNAKPLIESYASSLFHQLTQGRYQEIRIDDDFNFLIMDDGDWYPLSRFSGGEIDCANLCLRIAISNAIRDFTGCGAVGFMAFDEIFGSQDNDRRNAIINALYSLQEQYRQIFIISHIDDVKEMFPSILHVQQTGTGSRAMWLE
ncbi:MAG: SMC family ATPase [Spirochaetota bacterium]